jgi:hypothetical protein
MKLVVTENIQDIEYCNNCTGKSKGQTEKIQNAIGFFAPQIAKREFEGIFKHNVVN